MTRRRWWYHLNCLAWRRGGSAAYRVVLETEPTADVRVSVSGTAGTDLTVSPISLKFTPENWSTAQVVTVESNADPVPSAEVVALEHIATGGGYDSVEIADVAVTVTDGDITVIPDVDPPVVTITADVVQVVYDLPRDAFDLDDFSYTVAREGPMEDPLEVSVTLIQDGQFLPAEALPRTVTIPSGSASAQLEIAQSEFTGGATADGSPTATVSAAEAHVVGTPADAGVAMRFVGPPLTSRIEESAYQFPEDIGAAELFVVAETASGVPAPSASVRTWFAVSTRVDQAITPDDYPSLVRRQVHRPWCMERGGRPIRGETAVLRVDSRRRHRRTGRGVRRSSGGDAASRSEIHAIRPA